MVGGGLVWKYENNSKQKHKTRPIILNLKQELELIFLKQFGLVLILMAFKN